MFLLILSEPYTFFHYKSGEYEFKVDTYTSDGHLETSVMAKPGDVIVCGPSKETYVQPYEGMPLLHERKFT